MRVVVQGISTQGLSEIASASMHVRMGEGKDAKPILDANGDKIWDPGQGRFFPTAHPGREIEVLEQDEDPPEVEIEIPNGTTGRLDKVRRPDPERMGRMSYDALMADQRFRIVQTQAVDSRAANAEVAAARAAVSRMAAELSDAQVALASLQAEHDALKEEHAEVVKQLDDATSPAVKTKGSSPSAPTTVVDAPKETPPA